MEVTKSADKIRDDNTLGAVLEELAKFIINEKEIRRT